LPGVARSRRPTDEPTTAHTPLTPSDILAANSAVPAAASGFDSDESTKLRVQSRDRRTPMPMRTRPPTPMPGTVHGRGGPPSNTRPPQSAQMQAPLPMPPLPQPGFPPPINMQPPQAAPVQSPYPPPQGFPPPQWSGNQPPMQQPPMQQQPPGNYPVWGGPPQAVIPNRGNRGASAAAPDMFDRPVVPRSQAPQVAGFGQKKPQLLQPWMLIVGALVMAGLAFAITRLLLS
jgi:hypothetical protein